MQTVGANVGAMYKLKGGTYVLSIDLEAHDIVFKNLTVVSMESGSLISI